MARDIWFAVHYLFLMAACVALANIVSYLPPIVDFRCITDRKMACAGLGWWIVALTAFGVCSFICRFFSGAYDEPLPQATTSPSDAE